jgi:hypothetical protein
LLQKNILNKVQTLGRFWSCLTPHQGVKSLYGAYTTQILSPNTKNGNFGDIHAQSGELIIPDQIIALVFLMLQDQNGALVLCDQIGELVLPGKMENMCSSNKVEHWYSNTISKDHHIAQINHVNM